MFCMYLENYACRKKWAKGAKVGLLEAIYVAKRGRAHRGPSPSAKVASAGPTWGPATSLIYGMVS